MKHSNKTRNFGRKAPERLALVRSLMRSLVIHGKIKTTVAKAKEIRPIVEKLVTLAKKDTLASKRLVTARLGGDVAVSEKMHKEIAPKYADRNGGYTRITKLGVATNVAHDTALIEFV
jgi:large subunit ribosomal protein L17